VAKRRTITPKVRAAARRNLARAHMARVRTKEPRSVGRIRPSRESRFLVRRRTR